MNFKECVLSSLKSLLSNKMRSLLTMLGIIIGISSVTIISTLGTGVKENVVKNLNELSLKIINIKIEKKKNEFLKSKDFFNEDDYEIIKNIENVKYVSPIDYANIKVKFGKKEKYMTLNLGNEEHLNINNEKILYGRNFTKKENLNRKNVVVIDEIMALEKYGKKNAVGENIDIFSYYYGKYFKFLIVGVKENLMKDYIKVSKQDNYLLSMPILTAQKYFNINTNMYLSVKVDDYSKKFKTEKLIIDTLENRKKTNDIYKSTKWLENHVTQINRIITLLSIFISVVAGISLIVGSLGIMNIMLVTVVERTREIGIRKALGAKKIDILIQFLIEALIIAFIGGVIGLTSGYFGSLIIGRFTNINPILDKHMIIISISLSVAVGILSGFFPAKKAANLNPIDAIRIE